MINILITRFKYIKASSEIGSISNYVDYIATREGSQELKELESINPEYIKYMEERPGSHGLFSFYGKCDIEKEKNEMVEAFLNDCIVWESVLSLPLEDAQKLDYNTAKAWQSLLNRKMPLIAEQFNISLSNLKWHAAFHEKDDHPHVHLNFYSVDKTEGKNFKKFQKEKIKKVKSILTNEIYKVELDKLKKEKTNARTKLVNSVYSKDNVELIQKELGSKSFSSNKYGYLNDEEKKLINDVVSKLLLNKQEFLNYLNIQKSFIKYYNVESDTINKKLDEFSKSIITPTKKDFSGIHNAVLKIITDKKDVPATVVSNVPVVKNVQLANNINVNTPVQDTKMSNIVTPLANSTFSTLSLLSLFKQLSQMETSNKQSNKLDSNKKKNLIETKIMT